MAAIKRLLVPIALISLLLLSESLTISSAEADHGMYSNSFFTGILRRNMLRHPSEHRRADKDIGSSLAEKMSIKRGARSAVIAGRSSGSSSSSRVKSFNVGSVICFYIAFTFAFFF